MAEQYNEWYNSLITRRDECFKQVNKTERNYDDYSNEHVKQVILMNKLIKKFTSIVKEYIKHKPKLNLAINRKKYVYDYLSLFKKEPITDEIFSNRCFYIDVGDGYTLGADLAAIVLRATYYYIECLSCIYIESNDGCTYIENLKNIKFVDYEEDSEDSEDSEDLTESDESENKN